MNALQPQRDPNSSGLSQRLVRREQLRQARQVRRLQQVQKSPVHKAHPSRQTAHRALVVETSIKLAVNLALGITALSTLLHLIPYNHKQEADLRQLQAEVEAADAKVAGLQNDFDHHFDPQQALNVMQEQNIRFNPKQRQVVWLNPTQKADKANSDQQAGVAAPD